MIETSITSPRSPAWSHKLRTEVVVHRSQYDWFIHVRTLTSPWLSCLPETFTQSLWTDSLQCDIMGVSVMNAVNP